MEQTEFVRQGALILEQGMPGDFAYKIKSGRVELTLKEVGGQEVRLAEFGPGDMIGEMATLLGGTHASSARALTEVEVVPISRRSLQESMKRSPTMRSYVMDLIAQRTIRNICLFRELNEAERKTLPKGDGPHAYPDKAIIFNEGEPINDIHIICSGHVQEFRTRPGGTEATVDIHKAGDFLCKTGMFLDNCCYHTSARALNNAHIVKMSAAAFRDTVRNHGSVADRLFACIAKIAVMKQLELERQATMTAPELLAGFLRHVCDSNGYDPEGFDLPYKKSIIASRLGMKLETLSRAWPRLREHGIQVRGSRVMIDRGDAAP